MEPSNKRLPRNTADKNENTDSYVIILDTFLLCIPLSDVI